jgi:dienelactone hydrolase
MRCTLALTALCLLTPPLAADPLPGTKPLTVKGDIARQMVDGIHKYLDRETAASVKGRAAHWKMDFSSHEKYVSSVEPNRRHLRRLLGVVDERLPVRDLEYVSSKRHPAVIAETDRYTVYAVRWPVLPGIDGEGLLLEPRKPRATVIALVDPGWTAEQACGLAGGVEPASQFPRQLADQGCRVLVPVLTDRDDQHSANPKVGRATNLPHREFVYRMAYETGRHVIGYDLQRVFAAVDYLTRDKDQPPLGVVGYGEGAMLALYAAALDTRIRVTLMAGHFGPRERLWDEPIYRNVWGLLREFGDAELAALVAPRRLHTLLCNVPEVKGPPAPRPGRSGGAAPGRIALRVPAGDWTAEYKRALALFNNELRPGRHEGIFDTGASQEGMGPGDRWLGRFLDDLTGSDKLLPSGERPGDRRPDFDPADRHKRQFDQLVNYTQKLLPESERVRQKYWAKADRSTPEKWQASVKPYRDHFEGEIIGKLPAPTLPMNARTRLVYDTPNWKGYEVVLDLHEDVICHGILLVPNGIKPGEKRPVVVCQHGLEGRPTDVCDPKERTRYYNSFGAQLADRGYVVFAPQAPYIFGNDFRQLVRKAHPLKLSLYAFIVAQHERILDWLETLPFVDRTRIALYGLSYGGKVAMRVGALVSRYCAVICSGDFNEWIWKNITLDFAGSYMFTGEYDMYEFDLANTFNYAEMAYLISPRPFMVERGHRDGVGIDEYVAHEYAKVRRHYADLGLPSSTRIEFFAGGHEIHGIGTFAFLDRHLKP